MLLVGDVGGTHVRLALAGLDPQAPLRLQRMQTYSSRAFKKLEDAIHQFFGGPPKDVRAACLGVPGPVEDNRCTVTNLPWIIDGASLGRAVGLEAVHLLNDLEATAHGVLTLDPADMVTLQAGRLSATGNRAVIAAGTGLGEAGIHWDGRQYHPFATEGGHTDFGPRNDQEWRLTQFLQVRLGRVSVERVVSGPGIESLFQFVLQDTNTPTPEWFERLTNEDDASAAITTRALERSDPSCLRTLDWFVSLYGAEAGNVALKHLATGGVYVAGGIAPGVFGPRQRQIFLEGFLAKGRMRPLLEGIPVSMVVHPACALRGAAAFLGGASHRGHNQRV
jgi:glucokinase